MSREAGVTRQAGSNGMVYAAVLKFTEILLI